MQNFARILRSSLKYRWTILGIFLSSTLVAFFWGANIGALFPVIKIAVQGKPLQHWLDEEIADSRQAIVRLEGELEQLEQRLRQAPAESRTPDLERERDLARHDLKAARRELRTSRWLQPVVRWLPEDPYMTIVIVVLGLIAGTVLKGVFVFTNMMLVARLEQRVTFDLRRRFFRQCLRFDQTAFGQHRTSGLTSHFHADIAFITVGVKAFFGTALREPLKMASCLLLAGLISWRLLVFSLVLTPITALAIRQLGGSIKRANRRSLEEFTTLFGVLTEAFQGIETVHAFTLEPGQRAKFFRVAKTCLKKSMRIALYNALTKPITEILGICAISLALLMGSYLTIKSATHIGPIRMVDRPIEMEMLLMFFGFLIGATEPARKLSDIFNSIQAGSAAADRLMPLLDKVPSILDPPRPRKLPDTIQRISLRRVDFHYHPEQPVLCEIDLRIEAGETLAIVGPNGCGKSTLIKLLPRFFDPVSGQVCIDDVDLRDVRLRELRRRIGMVSQRALLFDDTVYNNILQGRPDATQADVMRAARQAKADRFIQEKLERGYDTIVGTAGNKLSGGQRQRLALARAMLRDPDILILDEATSQIDIESEQLIHQALQQYCRGRTAIIVTHRLATLELADRILVMDHGRIQDVGTHAELIERSELYQRLNEIQFKRSA